MKGIDLDSLKERFGPIPHETGFKKRMRLHQGWWRVNVLNELPGLHPTRKSENICSSIQNGRKSNINFLTENTIKVVLETLLSRDDNSHGMIEEDRLFNNLLSSQPLCFNFFSELSLNKFVGLKWLQNYYHKVSELVNIHFEYAPPENYTTDNTAFDVAFEVREGEKSGIIGWECKYTDDFSKLEYDRPAYKKLYSNCNTFNADYNALKQSKFNQLFREQLVAEGLLQHNKYEFVYTGLFCHHNDSHAINTASEFKEMLNPEYSNFQIITYLDFIKEIQQLDISWELREWSMLLWARYCGGVLSEAVINEL